MNRTLLTFVVAGALVGAPAFAQEPFDVQGAMEQVRKENIQRLGVERKQQIVSTLRKRAEDLAAIEAAGFTVTADGELKRKEGFVRRPPISSDMPSPDVMGPEGNIDGMFREPGMDGNVTDILREVAEESDAEDSTASEEGYAKPFALRGILSNSAMFEVNDELQRYAKGDTLPGGYLLKAILTDSVQVESPSGTTESLYMSWSPARNESEDSEGNQVFSAGPGAPFIGGPN